MPVQYHRGKFPPANLDWQRLVPLIGPAAAAVARFDGSLAGVPNTELLLSPLTTQEAVLSSKIEGTHATMGEVLSFEAGSELPENRVADIQEVLNYRRAMRESERLLETLPLTLRLVRSAHEILMDGVRGSNKAPGELRKIPNWIGPAGCTIESARFVPTPANELEAGLAHWETYIHSEQPDRLVQLAIIHAEFEALHPFLDGNGRLGRMIVPLYMWQMGLIQRPIFYISAYFDGHREEYFERLLAVSRDDDWTGWCIFFLDAVREQATQNHQRTADVIKLYDELKPRVQAASRSQYAINALDYIFNTPIFKSTAFIERAGIPEPTAKRLLAVLKEEKVLNAIVEGRGRRASVFTFPALLNIAEGYKAF